MKFSVEVCFDIFSIKFLLSVKLYYTAKIVICSVNGNFAEEIFVCWAGDNFFASRQSVTLLLPRHREE